MRIAVSGKGGTGKTTISSDEKVLDAEANGSTLLDSSPEGSFAQAVATLADRLEVILNGTAL